MTFRVVIVLLAALAVTSALFRAAVTIQPRGAIAEAQRDALRAVNGDENLLLQYETRFATRPAMTLLHVVPGALFLSLGLLQFSSRVRNRWIRNGVGASLFTFSPPGGQSEK